jgi:hypothetical protein
MTQITPHENFFSIFFSRRRKVKLMNSITIKAPLHNVWKTITTPRIWADCYPETINVGGVTDRPIRPGDLFMEKFLFNGTTFACFLYKIQKFQTDFKIVFTGEIIMNSDTIFNRITSPLSKNIRGSFEYTVTQLDNGTVRWDRTVHYYHVGGLLTQIFWKFYLGSIIISQQIGANIFVQNVKAGIENDSLPSFRTRSLER